MKIKRFIGIFRLPNPPKIGYRYHVQSRFSIRTQEGMQRAPLNSIIEWDGEFWCFVSKPKKEI